MGKHYREKQKAQFMTDHPPPANADRDTPLDRPGQVPVNPTLPPEHRYVRELLHALVDGAAIAALVTLCIVKDLDTTLAVTMITLIAGASIGGQLRKGAGGMPHGLVLGLLGSVWDALQRLRS